MAATLQTATDMGRPKSDNPKDAVISLRTFHKVRTLLEEFAKREHRTLAQMAELMIREAIIMRLTKEKRSVKDIESLP